MSTSAMRTAISLAILVVLASSVARAAEVKADIDWPQFMARHDLVWNSVPSKWGEGAFTGNGLLGLMMYATDDGNGLRFRVGRTDVMIQEKQAYRVPIGGGASLSLEARLLNVFNNQTQLSTDSQQYLDLTQIPTPPYFGPYVQPNPFFGTGNAFAPPRRLHLAATMSF